MIQILFLSLVSSADPTTAANCFVDKACARRNTTQPFPGSETCTMQSSRIAEIRRTSEDVFSFAVYEGKSRTTYFMDCRTWKKGNSVKINCPQTSSQMVPTILGLLSIASTGMAPILNPCPKGEVHPTHYQMYLRSREEGAEQKCVSCEEINNFYQFETEKKWWGASDDHCRRENHCDLLEEEVPGKKGCQARCLSDEFRDEMGNCRVKDKKERCDLCESKIRKISDWNVRGIQFGQCDPKAVIRALESYKRELVKDYRDQLKYCRNASSVDGYCVTGEGEDSFEDIVAEVCPEIHDIVKNLTSEERQKIRKPIDDDE